MSTVPSPIDRRADIKARHRRSIVEAASTLMRRHLASDFSVDELAREAEVSRRTIFNHFASMDDVVIEVFGNELGAVVEKLASHAPSSAEAGSSMFDELADTFRSTDLIPPMVYLTRVLGSEEPGLSPRQAQLAARSFTQISGRLTREMHQRHPGSDPLEVTLLVASMTNGLLVMYTHWVAHFGAVDTIESRTSWSYLLERLIESLRTGFGAGHGARHLPASPSTP